MKDQISVITPTYYRNDCLRRAIRSVESQTYEGEIEHIVIDGSEESHAEDIADEFSGVQYIAPSTDPGFHKSRELGIKESDGRYIQFLDDDDQLSPSKLEKCVEKFDQGIGVVYCGIQFTDKTEPVLPESGGRGDVLNRALALDLYPAVPSTWTVRRDLITEILPFKHPDGADDEGTHIEMAQRTKYDFVNEPLVVMGTDTEESYADTWDYVDGISSLYDQYADLYSRAPDWVEKRALTKIHSKRGEMLLREKSWSHEAVIEFAKAARYANEERTYYAGIASASILGTPGKFLWNRLWNHVGDYL
jgi:glycosyltransferase involved in cell wall biosynthesis